MAFIKDLRRELSTKEVQHPELAGMRSKALVYEIQSLIAKLRKKSSSMAA